MKTKLLTQEGELEVWGELIEVTSLHEKDPTWRVTDEQGHEHRWHIPYGADDWQKQNLWRLPTVRAVHFTFYYPDGGTGYGVHYYCKRCGERIHPGYRASPYRRYLAGPRHFSLGGEEIDSQRAESILKRGGRTND